MTDKVQKIRKEVARIQLYTQSDVLKQILDYIDEVQKEPVKIWHDASEKSNEPEEVVIINPSDNTGKVVTRCVGVYQGRIWAYTSELLNLYNSCNIGKNLREEPVSEDLDKAAGNYAFTMSGEDEVSKYYAFLAGAKWKEDQFEKNRLAACDKQTEKEAEIESDFVMGIIENEHRQPTFDDAIKYGMRLQKEQMIEDAFEREVKVDAGGYPYIPQMELYDYDKDIPLAKEGDKYKIILIKEN